MRTAIASTLAGCTLGLFTSGVQAAAPPPAASAAGFLTETFATDGFTLANVDQSATYAPNRQWYLWNFFGKPPAPTLNRLLPDGTDENFGISAGQIATAAKTSSGFVGTAFGDGGYFEAEIAFEREAVDARKGWPAWWAMALEHLIGRGDEWAGQPSGFRHFIEVDAFEYNRPTNRPQQYGATVHDWFGLLQKSCPGPRSTFCSVDTPYGGSTKTAPEGTDWSAFHKIAFRWVPATQLRQGAITFYMDDRQMGDPVYFSSYQDQPPPPKWRPWSYSIVDRQHLVLILGGSPSGMRIRSVHVWQRSAAGNLKR